MPAKRKKSNAKKTISSSKQKRKTSKKISLKDVFDKVVGTVKKPFSSKTTQQTKQKSHKESVLSNSKKQTTKTNQKDGQQQTIAQQQSSRIKQKTHDVPFAESTSKTLNSKFFYSIDESIDNFDDMQLYEFITTTHPGLSEHETNETTKRNAIVNLLNDIDLMNRILDEYNMSILDFFKFLFRLCPSVFKGLFIKKIQKTLKDKSYAQSLRFGKYSFTRSKASAKRCSIF